MDGSWIGEILSEASKSVTKNAEDKNTYFHISPREDNLDYVYRKSSVHTIWIKHSNTKKGFHLSKNNRSY